jgi:hypothetical protein
MSDKNTTALKHTEWKEGVGKGSGFLWLRTIVCATDYQPAYCSREDKYACFDPSNAFFSFSLCEPYSAPSVFFPQKKKFTTSLFALFVSSLETCLRFRPRTPEVAQLSKESRCQRR